MFTEDGSEIAKSLLFYVWLALFHINFLWIQMIVATSGFTSKCRWVPSCRSRGCNRTDYFRIHQGFRDNYRRKSALPFVSRIKFLFPFFSYSTTPFIRYEKCLILLLSLFPSIYLSDYLFSFPVVFISLSISGRKRRESRTKYDIGLQTNWYRLVSDETVRSTFCVESVERMNYLSESLISRATKWNVGTTTSPLSGSFLRGLMRPCSGVDVNINDTTNRDSSLLSHNKQ